MVQPRFLLVTFPVQGHINPTLQFAKRLVAAGADVTFVTSLSAHRRMTGGLPTTISFAPFPVEYDEGFKHGDGFDHCLSELWRRGSQAISDLVVSATKGGRPYISLVYTLFVPWAGLVADELRLPSILLWIQPATVFDIYYYYFHGYGDAIRKSSKEPKARTTLPRLSLEFTSRDFPSFTDANDTYSFAIPLLKQQFEMLDKKTKPKILVNTFDQLETEALTAIDELSLIGIGPLIPSAFLDEKDPSDRSFGGDLSERSHGYIEWLKTKPKTTVVYVSFGSLSVLSKRQMEEIARGLLESGRPFLWVVRDKAKNDSGAKDGEEKKKEGDDEEIEDELKSYREELEKLGKIVPWCSQVEVLSHPSLGCFVTHCGWNSTLESLVSGVPVVAFPQWTDQGTNAKLIEDVWKTGVRVKPNEEGIVEGEELKRCLELVIGGQTENRKEMEEGYRRNTRKWKDLAREAGKDGGSSDKNLKAIVAEVIAGRKLSL